MPVPAHAQHPPVARRTHCFSIEALSQAADGGQRCPALPEPSVEGLSREQARDLAELLPFLACGEESAVHAFGGRLLLEAASTEREQLARIARDELRHAQWLEGLRRVLPEPCTPLPRKAIARFFKRLLSRNPARHFARVAALDLAVCRVLQPLLRADAALAGAASLRAGLQALVLDEARHVRVSRRMALQLGLDATHQRHIDFEVAHDLEALLVPVRAELQRLAQRKTST